MAAAPAPSAEPGWVERVTGRWAISWQVIVFGALISWPQMVLTGGTLGSHAVAPADMPTIAVVTGAFLVANSAYSWLAMVTVFRHRAVRPVPIALYVGFYLSAAVLPVLGMEASDRVLGTQSALPVPVRLFFAALTTLWLGIAFSYVLDGRDRFRREREALIADAVSAELATVRESEAAHSLRASLDRHVDASLADARERIATSALATAGSAGPAGRIPDAGLDDLAATLSSAADAAVRPLSHRLWQEADREYPAPRFRRVAALLWQRPTYLPLATAYVIAIGLPGASVRGFGALAPVALVALGAVVLAVLRLSEAISIRLPSARRWSYWTAFAVVLALVLAYSLLPGDVPAPGSDAGAVLIGLPAGVLLTSFIAALATTRQRALESLGDEVTRRHVAQEAQRRALAMQMREVARELHGSVQTRLISCAAAIERARGTGDTTLLLEAVREAGTILQGSSPAVPAALRSRLERAVGAWEGLMDVRLLVDEGLRDGPDGDAVVEVVEEALSNAYRHGDAGHVTVTVSDDGGSSIVEVIDDGSGPAGGAREGLGTSLMRGHGRMVRQRVDGTTVVHVTIGQH